ncbi:phenylalanine ammonia-lyase [Poronia punctata]|nr:phenylalanine ammonia-lyase [Poronia punctata]
MQHTQSAIVTSHDKGEDAAGSHEFLESNCFPTSWVRSTILTRCNTNIRGHSAMTPGVVDALFRLVNHDIIPLIPIRGSISASGDLMPLSYVSGAIQGNPDIYVRVGGGKTTPKITTAYQALKEASIEPIILGPKDGLSLINGTAASAAVACLALNEANQLALISQMLTCLTSEALYANNEWAHPFIHAVRPHPGQIEAAQNIRVYLRGSKLSYGLENTKDHFKAGLVQERYALRTSPQWLAPHLEDLLGSEQQLVTELNSTTDNPIVNVVDQNLHCGGNFQAASVTSTMEKTRLSMMSIGKMLFHQTSEMINPRTNNGLPPNLAADEPSLSFCLKGIDVNTAAYMSELSFLANPVSNHVQSAEMHNQSINSLGLLSARQTMGAIKILSMIVANCLYTGCQGVDLRTMHRTFLAAFQSTAKQFIDTLIDNVPTQVFDRFWRLFEDSWYETAPLDIAERCDKTSESLVVALTNDSALVGDFTIAELAVHQKAFGTLIGQHYQAHRDNFFENPTTMEYLGQGSKVLYTFVREHLGIPMHRGLVEHPIADHVSGNVISGRPKRTIGSGVTMIYEAIRDGSLYDEMFHFLGRTELIATENGHALNGNGNGHVGNGHV